MDNDTAAYLVESRSAYIARVESEGGKIIIPGPFDAQVDIDTEDQYEQFCKGADIYERVTGEQLSYVVTESKSGLPKRHIRVTTGFPMDDVFRIALQAALGSDPIRELLSLIRVMHGVGDPTVFAEWE